MIYLLLKLPKSNAERQAALRKRRAAEGLKEIRGIWVNPSLEAMIKNKIKELVDGRGLRVGSA